MTARGWTRSIAILALLVTQALAAAGPGDTVLVRRGSYGSAAVLTTPGQGTVR